MNTGILNLALLKADPKTKTKKYPQKKQKTKSTLPEIYQTPAPGKLLVFGNAVKMRPKCTHWSAGPAITTWGGFFLFRDDLRQVTIALRDIGVTITESFLCWFLNAVTPFALLLTLRYGRLRNQEVYAASLELRLRRENQNAANDALRTWFAENVIWVRGKDLAGGDRTCDFFYVAI